GRVAEKLILDDISTGASNDIERATSVARNMVTRYGFSEKLGTVLYGNENQQVFLGRDYSRGNHDYSENIAAQIDEEVRALIDEAFTRCEEILTQHRDMLESCAQYLIRNEKIDGPDFYKLINGEIDLDGKPVVKESDLNLSDAKKDEALTEEKPEAAAPAETAPVEEASSEEATEDNNETNE
ncbi:MAG: ATP-dependent zinc metalloprotease FtsH, partial [Oscillospiraceae bacterium]|nr:ATP-dependent zinc metalloprotease FtsH [Oscillospiraceae bacterium]